MTFCILTLLPICEPMMNTMRRTAGFENARTMAIMYGFREERHWPGSAEPTGNTRFSSAQMSAVLGSGALTNFADLRSSAINESFERVGSGPPDAAAFFKEDFADFRRVVDRCEFIR